MNNTAVKTMRILVTGDRKYTDGRLVEFVLVQLERELGLAPDEMTLIHGAASGADMIAANRATLMCWRVERYPAEWKRYGRAAGPIRNKAMLDSGVDICIAFHDDIHNSKGTRDMLTRCLQNGIKTALYGQGKLLESWNWE